MGKFKRQRAVPAVCVFVGVALLSSPWAQGADKVPFSPLLTQVPLGGTTPSNQPEITRAHGRVKIDWTDLIKRVEMAVAEQDGHPVKLEVALLVNGDEKARKPYPSTDTSIEYPDSVTSQRDYYLEITDEAGHVRHRTDVVLEESSNAQTVPGLAYASFLSQNGLAVQLPASLRAQGIDAELTRRAVQLGYEKTVWVLAPHVEAAVRKLLSERDDVEVIPKLNANGKPISADIVLIKTGQPVMANVKASNFFFKVDAAFNGNCFFWDDMFVSLATVPYHPELARATVEFWLAVQKMNGGTIPREVRKSNLKSFWYADNVRAGEPTTPNLHFTNPYLIHRVADELYRYNPSTENLNLLKRVSASMERYADWIEANRAVRDAQGQLVGFVTDALGSGGDNARGERGNTSAPDALKSGWTDLLAQQIDLHKHLVTNFRLFADKEKSEGDFSASAVDSAKAEFEDSKAKSLDRLLNAEYWDPQKKFYYDLIPDGHGGLKRDEQYETIFSFWPLLSHSVSPTQLAGLSAAYLTPEKFGGTFPLPSNARDTIPFTDVEDDGYWNKWAHWPSVASVTVHGFQESGRPDLAYQLAIGFLKGMTESSTKTVYEFYGEVRNGLNGSPGPASLGEITGREGQHRNHVTRADFAGWGKLPPIYDLLETVIGIDPQADGHMRWNLLAPLKDGEELSVSNLSYKGQALREMTVKRLSEHQVAVTVKSAQPIDLELVQYRSLEGTSSVLHAEPVASSVILKVGGDTAHAKTTIVDLAPIAPVNNPGLPTSPHPASL